MQSKICLFQEGLLLCHIRKMAFGHISWCSSIFEPFPKMGKFNTQQVFHHPMHCPTSHCQTPLMQNTLEMSTLLNVAARVDAAVESYLSVQEFADK